MAKNAWENGWERFTWAPPIKEKLEAEKVTAQSEIRKATLRAQEAAEAEREAARAESIDARKTEHQMLKAARNDVLSVLLICAELIPHMRQLTAIVGEALKPVNGKPAAIAPQTAMGMLVRHATLMQKAVGATEAILQLSRLERGASTVNVGFAVPDEDLTPEQALEELEAVEEVLRGARSTMRLLPSGTG